MNLGSLVVAAALFKKPFQEFITGKPGKLTQVEWEKINPGGSYNDYLDYLTGD